MKVQRKKNKKIIPAAIIISVLLAGCISFYFIKRSQTTSTFPTSDHKSASEIKNDLNTKSNLIKNPDSQSAPSTATQNASSIEITGSQNASDVTIFTKLHNISSGNCALKITNGMNSYGDTAAVIYQSEFSSCAGFTISKNKVGGAGTWNIEVTVTSSQVQTKNSTTLQVQ